MSSEEHKPLKIEEFFLSLIGASLAVKDTEIPSYSSGIMKSALNRALEQYLIVREKDPTVDPFSVLETAFIMNLELARINKLPVILICNHQAAFNNEKTSPYSIVVVQPNFPSAGQYEEKMNQYGKLLVIRAEAIDDVWKSALSILGKLKEIKFDFACFPELFFLDKKEVCEAFSQLANEKDSFIIGGSFHDEKQESNTSVIFLPDGKLIKQNKIFRSEGEGIVERQTEILHIIDFDSGKFCVLVCIDSEREAVREILKERLQHCKCPALIFNPSHTDHPKRSIGLLTNNLMTLVFAAIVFCNTYHKGGSAILAPFAELKDKDFKILEISASADTQIEKAEVDLAPIISHRQSKHKCLISTVE